MTGTCVDTLLLVISVVAVYEEDVAKPTASDCAANSANTEIAKATASLLRDTAIIFTSEYSGNNTTNRYIKGAHGPFKEFQNLDTTMAPMAKTPMIPPKMYKMFMFTLSKIGDASTVDITVELS